MRASAETWQAIAERAGLIEPDIGSLASWGHCNVDLGGPMEALAGLAKSRRSGFLDHQGTPDAFTELPDKLKADRVITGCRSGGRSAVTAGHGYRAWQAR